MSIHTTRFEPRRLRMATFSLLIFTMLFAQVIALSADSQDIRSLFEGQENSIKADLGPQLSGGEAAILESSDGLAFNEAKMRWSDYGVPGVASVVNTRSEQDIVKTIQYANEKNRQFLVQSSGHGWSNMSMFDDLILIKVDSMKNISIDTNMNLATVGAGITMGELIKSLFAVQRQTTLGTCDCPGVIGAMLGGGHGRLQGLYGLLLDQLVSARVVLHNGTVVTTSYYENTDLFWGIRGAGHNFGIVVSATVRIYPVQANGLHYNAVTFYEDWQLETIFGSMNNITLPERSSAYVMFFTDQTGKSTIAIDFTYAGRAEDGKALVSSVFDTKIPYFTKRQELVLPWSELNSKGMLGIAQAWCERGWRKNAHSTGINFYNLQDVRNVWNGYRQLIQQNPSAFKSMFIWETYPMQGMRNRDWTQTAYANRDIMHIVVAFLIYESPDLDAVMTVYGENTFRNVLNSHNGYSKPRVYVNYGHGSEKKGEFYGWDYWRQQKLVYLKNTYDPKGKFNVYHSVPNSLAGFN